MSLFQKVGLDASDAINELNSLSNAIDGAADSLHQLGQAGVRLNNSNVGSGAKKATSVMVQFANGAKQAVSSLDQLVAGAQRSQGRFARLRGILDGVSQSFNSLGARVKSLFQSFARIAALRAMIGAINLLRQSFTEAVSSAKEFQLAIAEIQTIAGSMALTNEQLSAKVLELSSALGTGAADTARGFYQVLSNQVVEAGEAFIFLEEAQKLAITTVASTGDAVDALSSVFNSYGKSIEDVERISGSLFEAVNVGRFKLEDIADIIGRVTPLAAQMGVEWNEVAAAIATMTQQGVRADTAITQLRAVLQKIIKPTEAMQQKFREWGVEDGPAAIATFGGVSGVLNKLLEETKGSTTELTKYFNRVRALTGVLSITSDEGERMAVTLDQINDSATRAAEAFEGFQASQVQQMVIATNRLKNALIELGTAAQPIITSLLNFAGKLTGSVSGFVKAITAATDETTTRQRLVTKALEDQDKRLREQRTEFTRFSSDEFKKQEQALFQSLAEQTVEYNKFYDNISSQQSQATAQFKGFVRSLTDSYTKAIKPLGDFVKNIGKDYADSRKKIADIDRQISDERFEQELAKYDDQATKIKKIMERAQKDLWEARAQINKIGLSKEARDEAIAQAKRAEEGFRQAKSLAGDPRTSGQARQAAEGVIESLETSKKAYDTWGKNARNQVDSVGKEYNKLKGQRDQFEQTERQLNKLLEKRGEIAAKGTTDEKELLANEIEFLEQRLKQLAPSVRQQRFIDSLFPEANVALLRNRIERGLTEAKFDWARAVDSLQRRLQAQTFRFNAEADLGDRDVRADAEALGVPFDAATQADTALYRKNVEKAKDVLAEAATRSQDLAAAQQRIKTLGGNAWDALRKDADLYIDKQKAASEIGIGFFNSFHSALLLFAQGEEAATGFSDQVRESMAKTQNPLRTFVKDLEAMKEKLDAEELIPEEDIKGFQERLKQALGTGNISADQQRALEGLFNLVQQTQGELKNLKDASADLEKLEPKVPIAEQYVTPLEQGAKAMTLIKDSTQTTLENLGTAGTTIDTILNPALDETKTAATDTATAIGSVGPSANSAVKGINNATTAMKALKEEAQAAAKAAAQAGGGGAAPQAAAGNAAGGMQYFHGGGLGRLASFPRGSDSIPAMLSRGEFVVNSRSSRKFFSELNAINQSTRPVYRNEGGSVTTIGDVHVTVQGGDSSRQTVREIGRGLQRELRRGTINLGRLRRMR
jgi:TP901 family phage tail tape measure protein